VFATQGEDESRAGSSRLTRLDSASRQIGLLQFRRCALIGGIITGIVGHMMQFAYLVISMAMV
jgi:hypothetical protein